MMRCFFLTVFLFLVYITDAQVDKYSKVKVYFDETSYSKIISFGVSLEGATIQKNQYLIGVFSSTDIKRFQESGLKTETIIDDMSAYFVSRNINADNPSQSSRSLSLCRSSKSIFTPSHFHLGSMGGYLTLDEILLELNEMRAAYPKLISINKDISSSLSTKEGRRLQYVKISDNPDLEENESKVLYSALTHAREPMGMQQMIFYMWYLLENYQTSPEVKYLVDNLEMYFVPCVNPDGYRYNQTTNSSGGGMLRTNRNGVDLNRNYGFQWGKDNVGSSPDYGNETYRGTAAFSEAETKSMKYLCESKNFVFNIDYHTYGNFLIYPNYLSSTDYSIFEAYSELINDENGAIHGVETETVGYRTNGASNDWFYGEQSTKNKILSWVAEVGNEYDNFWAPSNRIEEICKSNWLQNISLARFALKYATVKDENPFYLNKNGYLKYRITQLGQKLPATYTVSFQAISSTFSQLNGSKNYTFQSVKANILDSIPYSIISSTSAGTDLSYVISINNGLFTYSDTISKIYGNPDSPFYDSCNTINNWTTTSWGLTTSENYSSPKCITDSPNAYSASNTNTTITTTNAINLTNVRDAYLSFVSKWNIGKGYDYAQIRISMDNGSTWSALCGKYTSIGTSRQMLNEPVYDGYKMSWDKEIISLKDYIGKEVKFQFLLKTTNIWARDGFYFDDFMVFTYPSLSTGIIAGEDEPIQIYPNPTADNLTLTLNRTNEPIQIQIYNSLGNRVHEFSTTSHQEIHLNLKDLTNGIYVIQVLTPKQKYNMRFIKI